MKKFWILYILSRHKAATILVIIIAFFVYYNLDLIDLGEKTSYNDNAFYIRLK